VRPCVCVCVCVCARVCVCVDLAVTGWDSDGMVFGPQVREFFADPETMKIFNSFVSSGPSTAYGGADSPDDDSLQARGTCLLEVPAAIDGLLRFFACPLESSTSGSRGHLSKSSTNQTN
jgi:hypothetical protein